MTLEYSTISDLTVVVSVVISVILILFYLYLIWDDAHTFGRKRY